MRSTQAYSKEVKAWVTADHDTFPVGTHFKGRMSFTAMQFIPWKQMWSLLSLEVFEICIQCTFNSPHVGKSKGKTQKKICKSSSFACKSDQLPTSSWHVSIISHRAISCIICLVLKHQLLCSAHFCLCSFNMDSALEWENHYCSGMCKTKIG